MDTTEEVFEHMYPPLEGVDLPRRSDAPPGEDEIADSVALAARCEGVLLENAAAAGLAALRAHRARGLLPADAEVVLVASSTGLKSLGGRLDRPLDAPEVDDVSALQALTREQEEHRR